MISEAPINRFAAGLLGFADIKAMGKTPDRLGGTVESQLNIMPFYFGGSRTVLGGVANAQAIAGQFITLNALTVPQGKAFVLENIWAESLQQLAAAETIIMAIRVLALATPVWSTTSPLSPAFVTGDFPAHSWTPPHPVVLMPGTQFSLYFPRAAMVPGQWQMAATGLLVDF